ncbi:hypothetical protein [Azospirillum argentinense]|uniref:hypothetical protein n=1 Tax=Azospirillum argentinense TaxID=2970906 RepID=UPI001586EF59|nr:hypothetical protein [Azospirillum argentinense]
MFGVISAKDRADRPASQKSVAGAPVERGTDALKFTIVSIPWEITAIGIAIFRSAASQNTTHSYHADAKAFLKGNHKL